MFKTKFEHYIEAKCPHEVEAAWLKDASKCLRHHYGLEFLQGEEIGVVGRFGVGCAYVGIHLKEGEKVQEFEFFAENIPGEGLFGAFGLILDFGACILQEYLEQDREAWLTLDYFKHSFEGHAIYARQVQRIPMAEQLADEFFNTSPLREDI